MIRVIWRKEKRRTVMHWITVMFLIGLLFLPAPLGFVVAVVARRIRIMIMISVRRTIPTANITKMMVTGLNLQSFLPVRKVEML